jgi:SprT protein
MQQMHSRGSRSESKTPANMPSLRQLEFAFENVAASPWDASRFAQRNGYKVVGQALRLPGSQTPTEPIALQLRGRDGAFETEARELLRSLGAKRIAAELRVEWNSRLQTAAGRADYRQKLISLNPRLVDHPGDIDRTLRHELAHILAEFRTGRPRISPHGPEWQQACSDLGIAGEKRCHTLPLSAKPYAPRFVYRCPNCRRDFPRVRKLKRTVACLACCRAHNRGEFDVRFRLRLVRD